VWGCEVTRWPHRPVRNVPLSCTQHQIYQFGGGGCRVLTRFHHAVLPDQRYCVLPNPLMVFCDRWTQWWQKSWDRRIIHPKSVVFFLDQQNRLLFRVILNSCSCLLLVRSVVVRAQRFHSAPRASQWELRSTLPFPSCFLYNPKFPASRLLGLPSAFTLESYSAYSTLKMEAICSSETFVDFQRITRRYIPEDSTLQA
jgi:hypothetical protein